MVVPLHKAGTKAGIFIYKRFLYLINYLIVMFKMYFVGLSPSHQLYKRPVIHKDYRAFSFGGRV